jgi:hypothetical protein
MRKWTIAAGTILGVGLLGLPATAELPPSTNPLRFGVTIIADGSQASRSASPLLDVETGTGSITMDESEQGFGPVAGVEYDLQVNVDADPMISYEYTFVNGSDQEQAVQLILSCPMESFDQTSDGKHTVTVIVTDGNGNGATLTPDQFNFDRNDRTLQQAFYNAADLINPPFAQTLGDFLGNGDLGSSDAPFGAGEVTLTSGPRAIGTPPPDIGFLTPDGKWNQAAMNISFKISAGDTVTLRGKLEIGPNLGGGGGGGGGGGDAFGPFTGQLTGKLQAGAKKIGKVKLKNYTQGVALQDDSFSLQTGDSPRIDGVAEVKKNGKSIKLSLDTEGKAQLAEFIATLLSSAADQAVTVEFTKEPKGKASVKKDGARSKLVFAAKGKATMGDVVKKFTYKIAVKGALSGAP